MSAAMRWGIGIASLFAMSFTIHGAAIYWSLNDPSFAVEPDYESKAAHYDDVIRQRQVNESLGWRVTISSSAATSALPGSDVVDLEVRLLDAAGAPLEGAHVELEACHVARAARRQELIAAPRGDGLYVASLVANKTGIWEFRVTVARAADVFTAVVRQDVVSPRQRRAPVEATR